MAPLEMKMVRGRAMMVNWAEIGVTQLLLHLYRSADRCDSSLNLLTLHQQRMLPVARLITMMAIVEIEAREQGVLGHAITHSQPIVDSNFDLVLTLEMVPPPSMEKVVAGHQRTIVALHHLNSIVMIL